MQSGDVGSLALLVAEARLDPMTRSRSQRYPTRCLDPYPERTPSPTEEITQFGQSGESMSARTRSEHETAT